MHPGYPNHRRTNLVPAGITWCKDEHTLLDNSGRLDLRIHSYSLLEFVLSTSIVTHNLNNHIFVFSFLRGIGVYPRCAAQPVGFEAATLASNSRVRTLREMHDIVGPIIVVESFIVEVLPNK